MNIRASAVVLLSLGAALAPARAGALTAHAPRLDEGDAFEMRVDSGAGEALEPSAIEARTFWDLGATAAVGSLVRWTVVRPADAGLGGPAQINGADRALCARDATAGTTLGCRLYRGDETRVTGPRTRFIVREGAPAEAWLPQSVAAEPREITLGDRWTELSTRREDGAVRRIDAEVVAEGIALVPAGPREVLLVREALTGEGDPRRIYRFIARNGQVVATLEGPLPRPGAAFLPERRELLVTESLLVDDGLEIGFPEFRRALQAGETGFLQYSVETSTPLSSLHPSWSTVGAMISIDQTGVAYQPDPGDPGSTVTLPEVWDFSALNPSTLANRTFNTTRSDLAGNSCGNSCSTRDVGATPADGTWQSYLKIDNFTPSGTLFTRDIFLINDNDTGANPSIDVPYVAQDELNSEDRTQICFAQSAGGSNRFLRFFRFIGPDPASATLGVGDTWTSGAWSECDDTNGLRLTAASQCGSQCYPGCSSVSPRARGRLTGNAGFRTTIVDDGFVRVPAGNYVPALLMRQDTDLQAGLDFIGVCNLGSIPNRAFDYFWIQEYYGLLALVSSPANESMPATDWSAAGNVTDGADFTWGPYPPYQISAAACLNGTRVSWSLPADGSNLEDAPRVSNYGYVVSWGSLTDPEQLADWDLNPNHTPTPGAPGYLAAPPGGEPTSTVITSWPGSSIQATVTTALSYTDPDVGDLKNYRSAAFFKVSENPARLNSALFHVSGAVAPFVARSGAVDLTLTWPPVPGASSYRLAVFDLSTKLQIACPGGLDCAPTSATVIHAGGATDPRGFGYVATAVDPCGSPEL